MTIFRRRELSEKQRAEICMATVAFKMLFYDRAKFLALILGIAFSTLLISQQSAIFDSVLQQAVQPLRTVRSTDVWVLKNGVEVLDECEIMPESYLYKVRSIKEVAQAIPYYQGTALLKTPWGRSKCVQIIGCDRKSLTAVPVDSMICGKAETILDYGSAIIDLPGFIQLFPDRKPERGIKVEIGSRQLSIDAFIRVPPNWSGTPMLYVSMETAADIVGGESIPITAILVKSAPGYTPAQTAEAINKATSLRALTTEAFAQKTIHWVIENSGVAENFSVTITMGIIIGIAIVGQTFYLFSVENLKQFAAMKAIGISNSTLLLMIMLQALYVSIIGYALGIGAANVFFMAVNPGNGGMRGMFMSPAIFGGTGVFIVAISLLSCVFCIRKVMTVDPGEVFRS
jgi:putative ABC transport system permease protein